MNDGKWYSFGFDDPSITKGMEVDFQFENTAYGNKVKKGTLIIVAGGSGASPAPAAKAFGGGRERVFPVPALHGDRSIIRQNALAHAVKTVELGWSSLAADRADSGDVLKTSKSYAEMVIKVARMYESYSAGDYERLVSEGAIEAGA
jgi:hypothetical protein